MAMKEGDDPSASTPTISPVRSSFFSVIVAIAFSVVVIALSFLEGINLSA
jgi:hypothetical protein